MLIMAAYWPVYADDSAFCNDPAGWEHFDAMVAQYPEDVPLQILHALKIGQLSTIGFFTAVICGC
jgi:hypothetical protein